MIASGQRETLRVWGLSSSLIDFTLRCQFPVYSQPIPAHLKVQWKGDFFFALRSTEVLDLMSLNKNKDICSFLNMAHWPAIYIVQVVLRLFT